MYWLRGLKFSSGVISNTHGIATVEESTGECVFITVVVSIPIAPMCSGKFIMWLYVN